jgi:hypothetical protein
MRHRELPPHEYARLSGTELGPLVAAETLMPGLRVLVVEDDGGEIVAHWALVVMYQAEGLGILPSHAGNPAVGRHLLIGMRELLQDEGASVVYTAAERGPAGDAVRAMLLKADAVPFDADVFFWPVRPRTALQ